MFHETRTRSIVKSIEWRIIATVIAWVVIYLYTGNLSESVEITAIVAVISMIAYYINERLWNKTDWGRHARK